MVYVDNYRAPFSRMIMCHMIADTHEELLKMADKIGVRQQWIQKEGTWEEHFDICLAKRKLAVTHGALQITSRELIAHLWRKR